MPALRESMPAQVYAVQTTSIKQFLLLPASCLALQPAEVGPQPASSEKSAADAGSPSDAFGKLASLVHTYQTSNLSPQNNLQESRYMTWPQRTLSGIISIHSKEPSS